MGAAARSLAVRQHDRRLLAARFLALVESVTARRAISANPTGFVVSGRR
jgi:hypothetical protein